MTTKTSAARPAGRFPRAARASNRSTVVGVEDDDYVVSLTSRHTAGHNLAGYHHDPDKVMVELFTEMDTFIPELGMCEPRPWHEHFPMKPRSWKLTELI
jgi:hypothetical protein